MVALYVILAVIVVAILWVIGVYNSLIRNKNLMQEAWSGIDVQLKQRHDLIPNLVKTVEGYMKHERGLLENIVKLRNQSAGTNDVQSKVMAETQLSAGLKQLFAVAEAYPDLKANTNFLDFQSRLAGLEEQIQLARRYYNGTVRNFNIQVSSFPGSLIATNFGFSTAPYFEVDQAEKAVPDVNFSQPA